MAEQTLTLEQQRAVAMAKARLRLQQQKPPAAVTPRPPPPAEPQGIPRSITMGGVPVQDIINLGAGAIRGAGSIGSTLMRPFETAEENALRRRQIDEGLANMLGAQPEAMAYGAGKLGTEIAGTMAVPGMLGSTAAAAGLPRLATALGTAGMSPKLVGGVPNALLRVLGGGTVGGISAGIVDPETAGYGAMFGAAIPAATGSALLRRGAEATRRGARATAEAVQRMTAPFREGGGQQLQAEALARALNNNPQLIQQAQDLISQGNTIEQVAVALRAPALASLARQVRSASPEVAQTYAERAAAQTGRITERAGEITGDVAAAAERRAAELQAQQKAIGSRVPTVSQRKVGETVVEERKALIKQRQTEKVTPAYNAAFDAAEGQMINMAPVETAAAEIRAMPATVFDPAKARLTAPLLARYRTQPGTTTGGPLMLGTPPVPPTANLREADELLKAINDDIGELDIATDKATIKNLLKLHSSVLKSVDDSLPADVAAQYANARDIARREVIEPFRKGWVVNLERTGATDQPLLLPENVTREVLKNDTNALRFAASFIDSPKAREAVYNGVQGQYRREVVREGVISPRLHETFMRKYGAQIDALDASGLNIRQTLDDYASGAKSPKDLDAIVEAEYAPLRSQAEAVLKQAERLSGTVMKPATRAEALAKARARVRDLDGAEAELAALAKEIETGEAFTRLAVEGDRIGIKYRKIASDAAGEEPTLLNRIATITFNILRRFRGELDDKLAAELAMDLLSADKTTLALQRAKGVTMPRQTLPPKPSPLRSPAARVAPGVAVSNMLAPSNQNALAE